MNHDTRTTFQRMRKLEIATWVKRDLANVLNEWRLFKAAMFKDKVFRIGACVAFFIFGLCLGLAILGD